MRKLDLTVPLNKDPAFEFPIKDERHRPINLGGAVIECYVKYKVTDSDDEAVLYKGVIITPSNQGRCKVSMRAEDVGGPDNQVYHLDVIQNGRRVTHYHGTLKKMRV